MKHKTLVTIDNYGDQLENTVFNIGDIEIGNNFTLDHVFEFMNDEQIYYINVAISYLDLNGDCRIIGQGSYSKIKVNILAYELYDFIKCEYNKRF